MRAFLAFTQKEFYEVIRTYKLFILGAVFLLLGMMSPFAAKFTPEILKTVMPEGMNLTLPEPSAVDSWAQFFKNVTQIGMIVLVIVFSGIMANELSKGTLINILTKGLSRSTVILSKFITVVLLWTAGYVLCFGVTYAYTVYFWGGDTVSNLLFSIFCLWLFGVMLLSCLILGGVLFKTTYGGLLLTGGFVSVLFLMDISPDIQKYNPTALASKNVALLTKDMVVSDFTSPVVITLVITVLFLVAGLVAFQKRQV